MRLSFTRSPRDNKIIGIIYHCDTCKYDWRDSGSWVQGITETYTPRPELKRADKTEKGS